MKKIFSVFILLLVVGAFVYSNQIFGMNNPNVKQFIVQDKKGNLFSMNMNIDEVIEILGTPKSSENLWAKYPDASVGFYEVKYDGIEFYYYDIDGLQILANEKYGMKVYFWNTKEYQFRLYIEDDGISADEGIELIRSVVSYK